ncbi:VOC family protein [Evansella clarkii]|uniref:VOC family protein n=1 Tax=Evansella clarkii TaxID=79879 RepID=UPI000996B16C|nr:VOC family protein [Evansella clarkii]
MENKFYYGTGIFIPVSDLNKSTKWYKEMLGFEMLHSDAPEANTMTMKGLNTIFCLVTCEDIKQPEFPKNNYDVRGYFNILTKDIDKVYEELIEKGAQVSDIHDYGNVRGFTLTDLDGNQFGIVT